MPCHLQIVHLARVDGTINDRLTYFALYLEKYKVVQSFFPCRMIESMRTTKFLVVSFLKLKLF